MTTTYTFRVPSGAQPDVTQRVTGVAALDVTYRVVGAITQDFTKRIGETVFAELTLLMETGVDFLLEGGDALVLE